MTLFIQLILAHLIGDFFLQTKRSVQQKHTLKLLAPALYIHIAIHTVLVLLFIGFDRWPIALVLGASHLVIDILKIVFQTEKTTQSWFFIDQGLHFISIFAIAYVVAGLPIFEVSEAWLPAVVALIFLSRPAAFFVGMAMSRWSAIISRENDSESTLPQAGMYIGILERLMIFAFIVLGHWTAIGFLMGAKSIFRFGDLTRAKDRKLTEYILIGTFLSFGIAMLVGIIYQAWIAHSTL